MTGQPETGKETGKTTAQMKTLATFTDISSPHLNGSWDFNSTWNIDTSGTINDGYPYLEWNPDNGWVINRFASVIPKQAVITVLTQTIFDNLALLIWSFQCTLENNILSISCCKYMKLS